MKREICEKANAGDKGQTPSNKEAAKVAIVDSDLDSDSSTSSSGTIRLLKAGTMALTDQELTNCWLLDSGASRSMTPNCNWFSHYTPLSTPIAIALGDNSSILAKGVGHVAIDVKAHNKWHHTVLQDILHVPELHSSLLSIAQLIRRGLDIRFMDNGCKIYDSQGTLLCEGLLRANLFILPIRVKPPISARITIADLDSFLPEGEDGVSDSALVTHDTSKADKQLWHCRLAHLHYNTVLRMVAHGMVRGMEIATGRTINACEPCILGKQTRAEISKHTESRSDTVLRRIFSDICEKLPTRSHTGFEYFVTFVDDKSHKVFDPTSPEISRILWHTWS